MNIQVSYFSIAHSQQHLITQNNLRFMGPRIKQFFSLLHARWSLTDSLKWIYWFFSHFFSFIYFLCICVAFMFRTVVNNLQFARSICPQPFRRWWLLCDALFGGAFYARWFISKLACGEWDEHREGDNE